MTEEEVIAACTATLMCFSLQCQQEALERGLADAKAAGVRARKSSSHHHLTLPHLRVPHFFKRSPLIHTNGRKALGELQDVRPLSSPEMSDKLESGGSVSRCRVHWIKQAL